MKLEVHKAGCAVITFKTTIESSPLPPGTSAQIAELIALSRALEIVNDKRVNIYKFQICPFSSSCPRFYLGGTFFDN